MRLDELLEGQEGLVTTTAAIAGIRIAGLTSDSRRVAPGFLFAALPGLRQDGRAHIPEALARGAVAVLAPPGTPVPLAGEVPVPLLIDGNPRRRLALMAARFYRLQPRTIAAVTGTNGKTSVADFLRQIWVRAGRSAASLGTLGLKSAEKVLSGSLTTPDPVDLHATLAHLAEDGIECLAMEASSHGLDQHRLDGVRLAAAGYTNLSQDHLDYHGSLETYFAAKLRLFTELLPDGGTAVLNADDEHAGTIMAALAGRGIRVLSYGRGGRELRLLSLEPVAGGQRIELDGIAGRRQFDVPLSGAFQVANALCAAGLAIATGTAPEAALAALTDLVAVPGRLARIVTLASGAGIYVDYAHTPDALANALTALRPATAARLIVVFGCGGDRDRGKRPMMGEIAAQYADRIIVTDDNPRHEDAAVIRRAILAACPGAEEIADRAQAIAAAMAEAAAGDVVLVAGKGHETGQIVGDRVLPFDDADVVRRLAGERS